MRLSELLEATVVTEAGDTVGAVHDVLLVPAGGGVRVAGLVAGGGALATRLGYTNRGIRGPALVAALARVLSRRTRWVDWGDVTSFADGVVRVGVDRQALVHPAERRSAGADR